MANIKETVRIIESSPINQPILLVGKHGIGKSQIVKSLFEKKGYRVITLFVGQMADAGDLIGLPDRKNITIEYKNSKGETITEDTTITEFCPPKWWPLNPEEKLIIFFDEVNRGKPEIMQCLMDMVLNRKLNGRDLPKETRIIGAQNPLEEGYYQVQQQDPAFLDRWNTYDFNPSLEEWVSYAAKSKFHVNVIGFATKYENYLDPPPATDTERTQDVHPSRRSWERVSDFLKQNDKLNTDDDFFRTWMNGVVGLSAAGCFAKYLKEVGNGISAGKIITDWNDEIKQKLSKFNPPDFLHLNLQIALFFEREESTLKVANNVADKYARNLKKYLDVIPSECMAEFMDQISLANTDGKRWPELLMDLNDNLADRFVSVMRGEDEDEEKTWE